MSKTQVSCPNCRQPVVVDLTQLFDLNIDPQAKNRLLSGAANLINCQVCGYQGNLATVIVYHDPDKELLLTYVPPEMGLPRNEQERIIGGLINQAINKLPQEKRKGYLLKPQETLTMQGLIERVLEADGVTREMIQAQQKRLNLLQRLAGVSAAEERSAIAQQEDALIDADFFALLNRLGEAAMVNGDRQSAQQLSELQKELLPVTTYGKQVQEQSREIETAISDLQSIGRELDREKLLKLILSAPTETRLGALVSLARPALDYQFFQLLSDKIDKARADGRERLVEMRKKLLQMTQEIDRQMEAHRRQVHEVIDSILETPDIPQAVSQVMPAIDEIFVQELQTMLGEARNNGDFDRSGKLQQIYDALQQASTPPEMALIEEYLDVEDAGSRQKFLAEHAGDITPEFMEMLAGIAVQVQSGEDKVFAGRVMEANRQALRFIMQRNLASGS